MARNLTGFGVNDRVNHSVYGLGTISMIDDQHVVIEFDREGRKKFVTSLMQLEHSDAPPPAKRSGGSRKGKTKAKVEKTEKTVKTEKEKA
ncbi:MAG TPA: hypothetical protein VJV23_02680 [Candidatus Polarisedimenticolia bacterium]|nr:hypothetical protein [Candidatus Polarisedimenticolia bacterium]